MLTYRKLNGYKYELTKGYIHGGVNIPGMVGNDYVVLDNGYLLIRKGYAWDGASGPTIDTKTSMRGSLVHDALYQLMREKMIGLNYREEADKELHRILLEDGMLKFRADYWYWFVRKFAKSSAIREKHPRGEVIEI